MKNDNRVHVNQYSGVWEYMVTNTDGHLIYFTGPTYQSAASAFAAGRAWLRKYQNEVFA
jgi:predicted Zn-dependent protease